MSGTGTAVVCPACGEAAGAGARFCEACGAPLAAAHGAGPNGADPAGPGSADAGSTDPGPASGDPASSGPTSGDPASSAPTSSAPLSPGGSPEGTSPAGTAADGASPCPACGGDVADDGYCAQCGARAPVERDHREERAAPHVAGVSDVGVRRRRNEDALALGTVPGPDPGAADGQAVGSSPGEGVSVLVVCDGVSSAPDSDVASQAAATAARDTLVAGAAHVPADDAAAWSRLLVAAGHAADDAARAAVDDATARQDPPSCTFAAVVAGPGLLVAGWLGDSRVYWLPDAGTPEQLTEDDSVAAELMADGMSRAAAERSPQAHAITRWLGADAEDATARTVATRPGGPGWVLACSDGLWNYASAPEVVADLLRDAAGRVGDDPLALSRDLVAWANASGGHDNVTVALARVPARTAAGDAQQDARQDAQADAPDDAGTAPTVRRRPPGSLPGEPTAHRAPPAP
ncbi:protein phosphatase 2C domain-containing protein [Cellulomonas sp. zg-ZUI22]|uniref:protein phosphatase 2C domain-containing protein n=1 Tax=Cellulomonas sp. zg-ZUI22 TaxID=2816955 RepID=UPI0027DCFF2D|nr:protein phosphatase 2C domain-containing protein [Cellulomonas sp. zg-ZUI22]